ncbi:MAG: hypothetical protein KDB61_15450, partial [Planctomycetes bacterium]|nr:hypothetical protein [Planctomycetota bacterium]
QGFWLAFERMTNKRPLYAKTPVAIQMSLTFILVIFGWVLFRSETLADAIQYLQTMMGVAEPSTRELMVRPIHVAAAIAGAAAIWLFPTTQKLIHKPKLSWVLPLQLAFWLSLIHLHYVSHVPFLYFQF